MIGGFLKRISKPLGSGTETYTDCDGDTSASGVLVERRDKTKRNEVASVIPTLLFRRVEN